MRSQSIPPTSDVQLLQNKQTKNYRTVKLSFHPTHLWESPLNER